jgi:hypothetical protein
MTINSSQRYFHRQKIAFFSEEKGCNGIGHTRVWAPPPLGMPTSARMTAAGTRTVQSVASRRIAMLSRSCLLNKLYCIHSVVTISLSKILL